MKKLNNLQSDKDLNKSDFILKWGWPAHASIADIVFNALPDDIKKNLDLDAMKDGSNDPDEEFKDTTSHHYPESYQKAVQWLKEGKLNYDEGNFKRASYCFGVASHYITDSFSAPHCVSHELSKDHHEFEVQANELTPTATYITGDLETLMKKGVEQGKTDWKNWKKTKDQSAAQSEINMGASVAYSAIKKVLS